MEQYDNFDEFQRAQPTNIQAIIFELRSLVGNVAPDLEESVKWGNGCWVNDNLPVIYVHSKNDYVQFGFFGGSMLDDPLALLEGSGKYVRYVIIKTINDINEEILTPLIQQAEVLRYK